jgi:lambda repressor-like predicted transcriptional regulator
VRFHARSVFLLRQGYIKILKVSTWRFIIYIWRILRMKTSDLVRELCKKQHISLAELSRRIGQTPQNLNKKLKRDTLSVDELKQIADAVGVDFDLGFVLPDGSKINNEAE